MQIAMKKRQLGQCISLYFSFFFFFLITFYDSGSGTSVFTSPSNRLKIYKIVHNAVKNDTKSNGLNTRLAFSETKMFSFSPNHGHFWTLMIPFQNCACDRLIQSRHFGLALPCLEFSSRRAGSKTVNFRIISAQSETERQFPFDRFSTRWTRIATPSLVSKASKHAVVSFNCCPIACENRKTARDVFSSFFSSPFDLTTVYQMLP